MLTNYEQLAARDAASKLDYDNALFQIEKLRAALIEYKAGYERAAEAVFMLNGKVERLREALRDIIPYVDTCNAEHREAQDKARAALKEGECVDI